MKNIYLTTLIILTMINLFGQGTKSNVDKDFKKITSNIFPVIKVAIIGNQTPDIVLKSDDQPVCKKIAGDLMCFYGIDKGSHFELLLNRQIPKNISLEQINLYAHDNLLNFINDKLQIHKTEFGGIGFSCGGDYEAALFTLPEIWNIVVERLGSSIVFAVPSKDMILFVSADNQADIDGLKAMIDKIHKDGEFLLSKLIFTYKDNKISLLK